MFFERSLKSVEVVRYTLLAAFTYAYMRYFRARLIECRRGGGCGGPNLIYINANEEHCSGVKRQCQHEASAQIVY